MHFSIDEWQFDVDRSATWEYSLTEYHDRCLCDVCRNYDRTVESAYPNLRAFLEEFGVHIFAPEQLSSYVYDSSIECCLAYKVYGCISQFGKAPMLLDGIEVTAEMNDGYSFYLTFSLLLPWHP